jgi:hypothetical protein
MKGKNTDIRLTEEIRRLPSTHCAFRITTALCGNSEAVPEIKKKCVMIYLKKNKK